MQWHISWTCFKTQGRATAKNCWKTGWPGCRASNGRSRCQMPRPASSDLKLELSVDSLMQLLHFCLENQGKLFLLRRDGADQHETRQVVSCTRWTLHSFGRLPSPHAELLVEAHVVAMPHMYHEAPLNSPCFKPRLRYALVPRTA